MILKFLIPILFLAFLTAGWVGVQFLARKMKTKNHFDNLNSSTCGGCTCGGVEGSCSTESKAS